MFVDSHLKDTLESHLENTDDSNQCAREKILSTPSSTGL